MLQDELGDVVPGWAAASQLNKGEHRFWRMTGLQTQGSANFVLKEPKSKDFRLASRMVSVTTTLLVMAESSHI